MPQQRAQITMLLLSWQAGQILHRQWAGERKGRCGIGQGAAAGMYASLPCPGTAQRTDWPAASPGSGATNTQSFCGRRSRVHPGQFQTRNGARARTFGLRATRISCRSSSSSSYKPQASRSVVLDSALSVPGLSATPEGVSGAVEGLVPAEQEVRGFPGERCVQKEELPVRRQRRAAAVHRWERFRAAPGGAPKVKGLAGDHGGGTRAVCCDLQCSHKTALATFPCPVAHSLSRSLQFPS